MSKLDTSKLSIFVLMEIVKSVHRRNKLVEQTIHIVGGSPRKEFTLLDLETKQWLGPTSDTEIKAYQYVVDKILKESYGS